ncbi:hypothetical protein RIF29_03466 [Crotalaria pallida]|uniref:Uncharacterized protein n=1 Tax=Crotalaria pallida TaxID=3830 RepID=A0AAN9J064_CROPI
MSFTSSTGQQTANEAHKEGPTQKELGKKVEALQQTLEFEDELAEKFGGGTQNKETGNEIEEIGRGANSSSSALDIWK